MKLTSLEAKELENTISELKETAVVYFWQNGCGPCEMLRRSLEALPDREGVKGFSISSEEAGELIEKYYIFSLPALLFFRDGELRKKTIGFKSTDSLEKILEEL